ncbi:hydantoinase/oxoprolinase family protein [Acidobacteriota bacterium]
MHIGVDTGGTFTDFVLFRGGRVLTTKVPSTPRDFSQGVLTGLQDLLALNNAAPSERSSGPKRPSFTLVHSSTVGTNALLERKGATTALITTKGFRDVLEIGRQTRPELYNLMVTKSPPLVPPSLRLEVDERVACDGSIIAGLKDADVGKILDTLTRHKVESVAICLLFSFIKPGHEQALARAARKRGFAVSASCHILPEFREYERTSTTVVNAYISPVVGRYIRRLGRHAGRLGAENLRIVQSNGGSLSGRAAAQRGVATLMSGPAAGVIGAVALARQTFTGRSRSKQDRLRLITFDMGGTSTDVCLVDGDIQVTTESVVAGHPVRVPMLDIHTVGAGGGSLAHLDMGGALHVGPQSSGADPGPACYGKGDAPAVTDANLLLKRISPEHFLGGRMPLEIGRSERAFQRLAGQMETTIRSASRAVIRIVNANMERAIRVISVERGYDPREFTLASFGGAGGLHAFELAAALKIPRVFIPRNPGVIAAWGALTCDVIKDYSQTLMITPSRSGAARLDAAFSRLAKKATDDLMREGFEDRIVAMERTCDLRYEGQSYELTVPAPGDLADVISAFHRAHELRYGHSDPAEPVEIVTARLRGIGRNDKPGLLPIKKGRTDARGARIAKRDGMSLYDRALLLAGNRVAGPALIVEDFATTLVPTNWRGEVDKYGNMVFEAS